MIELPVRAFLIHSFVRSIEKGGIPAFGRTFESSNSPFAA